ncbi:hypothetical protein V5799_012739 [Amblyomma americanum]|uniref:Uncharacterized protein n=1 Tax=Amblyomma americanum TaxID=6943 RepID=A0AAQ4E7U7_AMBAM
MKNVVDGHELDPSEFENGEWETVLGMHDRMREKEGKPADKGKTNEHSTGDKKSTNNQKNRQDPNIRKRAPKPKLPESNYKLISRPRGWNLNDYVPRRLLQAVCTAANLPYGDIQDEDISRINSGNNTYTISTLNRQCVSTYVRIKAIVIGEKNLDMTPYVAAPDDAIKRVVYNTYDIGTPEEVRQGFINLNPNIAALNARRIGKSRSILITFGEKKLPRQVFYWGSVFIVYPYRKRVETCYNIRKTAHGTDMCHKPRLKRCCRCGEGHPDPPEGELPAHKPKGIYFVGKKKNGGTTSPYDKKRRKEPPFTGAVDRMKNCIGGDSEDNK